MLDQLMIQAFKKGLAFEGFLRVNSSEVRTSGNGSKYLDMILSDRSGDIVTKRWDCGEERFAFGDIVKVRGMVTEFNNRLQFRADQIRLSNEEDGVRMSDFIPCAPYPPEDMLEMIEQTVREFKDEDIRNIVEYMIVMVGPALLTAPAAKKLHHAERSGLLHHTTSMMKMAKVFLTIYPHLDADLLYAGIILHDLGKIEEMEADEWGQVRDYTKKGLMLGHLVSGVSALEQAGKAVEAREEIILMLCHMVISHHMEPEFGSPRKPMFPEAELLHYIDLIDARMFEMQNALAPIEPGAFTEKIWSLDRRLYRREEG